MGADSGTEQMSTAATDRAPASRRLDTLIRNLTGGLVCGFLSAVLTISFGNLLLPPWLRAFVPVTIGMALFSNTVLAAVAALTSPIRGGVSKMQEIPIVALAGMATAIAASMAPAGDDRAAVATIVAATGLTTILTGLVLLLLGWFRLGGLVRFVPFPVIGGFLAGTGWLIVDGGVSVITGLHLTYDNLRGMTDSVTLWKCAAVAAFIGLLAVGERLSRSRLVLPVFVLTALVLYNLVIVFGGIPAATLAETGWLLPLPEGGQLWPPISLAELAAIDWLAVLPYLIGMPGVIIVTVLALLMNASGIELGTGRDIDLDLELRSTGLQNVLAGAGGGSPGYPSVSLSLLASRLGALDRSLGFIVAAVSGLALTFGDLILRIMPAPMLGALLVWVGGALIADWLVKSVRRLAIWEYLIVLLIFLVIAFVSFAYGILLGLGAAMILFLVEYGRVDSVRFTLTGKDYQSTFDVSDERQEALRTHGDAILIIQLQGFIFFGTADRLRKTIEARVSGAADGSPVRFLLIDFQRVSGIDSSTVLSFARLEQFAERENFAIVLTGLSDHVRHTLMRGRLAGGGVTTLHIEPTLDHGLNWCETHLLADVAPAVLSVDTRDVTELASSVVADPGLARLLAGRLERVEVGKGDRLIEQDTPSDDMYFIESGRAAIEIASLGGGALRVATAGPGAVVGEVAFYLRTPRSASIVADEPLVAWRLSRASLDRLEREEPELASRFHAGVTTIVSRRLIGANRLLRLLA